MSRFGAALAADPDAARAARRAAHGALGRVAGAPDLVVVTAALADPAAADRVAAAVAEQVAATGNDRCAVVGTMAEAVMGETSLGEAVVPGRRTFVERAGTEAGAEAYRDVEDEAGRRVRDDAEQHVRDDPERDRWYDVERDRKRDAAYDVERDRWYDAAYGVERDRRRDTARALGQDSAYDAARAFLRHDGQGSPPGQRNGHAPGQGYGHESGHGPGRTPGQAYAHTPAAHASAHTPGQTSVAVWAARLPGARIRPFRLHSHRVTRPFEGVPDAGPNGAMAVGGFPEPWPDERVALWFADPYSFPVDGFLARCNTLLPDLPFVGGLAPGPAGYGSARLLLGSEAYATGAVGVLLGGDVQAAIAVSQGCRAIGPAMTVTAAEGDVLLGLAGRPAYQRLREILAELPEGLREQASTNGLHLGIALNEYAEYHDSGDFLIRGVVGVLPERDAIQVGDHVEVGQTVRFQVRDAASAAEQLRAVLRKARRRPGYESIGGALLVSCHGRAAGLFPPPFGAAHDLHTVCTELGTGAVAGFFGTGEIGPVGGRNHLHGYTASVLAFAEGE